MADSEMSEDRTAPAIPLSTLSDAGAWLVRLSGPLRTAATQEGFQEWLKENPLHTLAFRRVSEEWDEADRLKRFTDVVIRVPAQPAVDKRSVIRRPWFALAAALALVTVAGAIFFYFRFDGVATGINELRVIALDDGSKVHLNTATRISVDYDKGQRRIRLESGEALFEVAKHSAWPFIVTAGDRQIRALGTAFLVRRDTDRVAVTLMDGKVAISGFGGVTLVPGERATFSQKRTVPILDRPALGRLLAWQQGKVAIDDLSLAAAVAEMNRYSATRLILDQPQPEELRISGVFIAGQSMSFARAVAQSYALGVVDRGSSIVLTGVGKSNVDGTQESEKKL
jgi:transmembrane sensor